MKTIEHLTFNILSILIKNLMNFSTVWKVFRILLLITFQNDYFEYYSEYCFNSVFMKVF